MQGVAVVGQTCYKELEPESRKRPTSEKHPLRPRKATTRLRRRLRQVSASRHLRHRLLRLAEGSNRVAWSLLPPLSRPLLRKPGRHCLSAPPAVATWTAHRPRNPIGFSWAVIRRHFPCPIPIHPVRRRPRRLSRFPRRKSSRKLPDPQVFSCPAQVGSNHRPPGLSFRIPVPRRRRLRQRVPDSSCPVLVARPILRRRVLPFPCREHQPSLPNPRPVDRLRLNSLAVSRVGHPRRVASSCPGSPSRTRSPVASAEESTTRRALCRCRTCFLIQEALRPRSRCLLRGGRLSSKAAVPSNFPAGTTHMAELFPSISHRV